MSYVRRCVDVVVGICCLFGFDDAGYSRKGTYEHWFRGALAFGNPMKFVKYKLAAFYAAHVVSDEPQELPPAPTLDGLDSPQCILSGRGYAWLRVLRRTPEVWDSFLCSILAAKKGMPRPDKSALKKAEKEAFRKLTTKRVSTDSYWLRNWSDDAWSRKGPTPEYFVCKTTMEQEIERTVEEVFEGKKFSVDDVERKPVFPSTSANYINSRSKGGAVSAILEQPGIFKKDATSESVSAEGNLIEIQTRSVGGRRFMMEKLIHVDPTALDWRYAQYASRLLVKAQQEEAVAVPLALAEALKTRVITKGPPLLMTYLKSFQKFCWKVLSSHPVFGLTGKTIDAEYIQSRLGRRLKVGQRYLSVDYSDATNEIHSWCSEAAARKIVSVLNLPDWFQVLLVRALTGHTLEYDGEKLDQETGQLMGSVVSFIFLCLVNGSICRWSLELDQDRCIALRDCPLAINGDDAVMRITEFGFDAWKKIAKVAGMSPSVGKVYFSSSFLNMNSATFRRVNDEYPVCDLEVFKRFGRIFIPQFTMVPYVNMGLLFGLTRSGTGEVKDTLFGTKKDPSLGAKCRELIGTAPSFMAEKLIAKFISHHKQQLTLFPIPWFIPEHLGGYGFPSAGRFRPTDKILRVAAKIFNNPEDYPIPSVPRDVPWRTWILAKKLAPLPKAESLLVQSYETSPNMSYNDLWSKLAISLLFRKGMTVNKLMAKPKTNDVLKAEFTLSQNAHRKLANTWSAALHDKQNPFYRFAPLNPHRYPKYHSLHDVPLLHSEARQPWLDFVTWADAVPASQH